MNKIRCAIFMLAAIVFLLSTVATPAVSALPGPPDPPAMTGFRFEVPYNPGKIAEDIIADIYGDSLIIGIVPPQQTEFNLIPTFTAGPGQTVTVNGVDQESTLTVNDFSSTVTYVVASGDITRDYKVRLVSTGLPLVYVYTEAEAPILSKDDYVDATLKIYTNEETDEPFTGAMGIRGRGNTTWTFPKKPYRMKLESAASLLGMPSDKDWVLLANYGDKSLMRNSLAYYLGHEMNFAYTQRSQPVDLVLNGIYQGSYVLGEHIKADKDRVNIEELEADDTDPAVINGGYFLELDDYRDGIFFELASGLPFVIKSPDEDELTGAQLTYISAYMQQTEDAIFAENFADTVDGYMKFINPETFIEWYWVNELFKNIDARDGSSIFYYKDRDGKLNMGPLWDFDVAAGNATVNTGEDPSSFYVRESKWFKRLFEDPAFKRAADARWRTLKDGLLATLPHVIDSLALKLDLSQELNFYKWDILNQPVFPSTLVFGSYDGEVGYLKEWLTTRISWIDGQMPPPELTPPALVSPAASETVETLSPAMKWFSTDRAEQYDLQVSLTEDFETLFIVKTGLPDTTYVVTEDLEEETTYYWRTRALNAEQQSEWSDVRSFTTPLITGLADETPAIAMFPNPTSQVLIIEIQPSAGFDHGELVDALGRPAARFSLSPGGAAKIDVGNLQRGMYVVILRGSLEKPLTRKIVLR